MCQVANFLLPTLSPKMASSPGLGIWVCLQVLSPETSFSGAPPLSLQWVGKRET